MSERVFNFSAGPATLPLEVLEKAQAEFLNFENSGMSVMEMSHRSKAFDGIIALTESRFRRLYSIPDEYAVLFLQGGASLQFSMIPMNLAIEGAPIDVLHTGVWTQKAIDELKKIAPYRIVASGESTQFKAIPAIPKFNEEASYVHMASNNTIYGTQWKQFPDTGKIPLVADMSSDILSRRIDISKFGLIFAGAQKNLGPSGLTLVIIKKELAARSNDRLPSMLNYNTQIKNNSLYNTPPTFGIYILGLILEWMISKGGLDAIETANLVKADRLYECIDNNNFYYCPNENASRSNMNVVFRIKGDNQDLESKFVKEAAEKGLVELKGHRSAGGLRASIYNAQTLAGVEALCTFMNDFSLANR